MMAALSLPVAGALRRAAPCATRRALGRIHATVSATAGSDRLTITAPDDWHLHVRDDAKIASVVPFTARVFRRALIMPNLVPPVRTTHEAGTYREKILAAVPEGVSFEPQMTLYLTDNTSPAEIEAAAASGFVRGCKLYPAGATTNSDAGVTDVNKCMPALEKMAELGLVLEVHGEVTHGSVDMFDRERVFLDEVLSKLVDKVPGLKIVMEHITTEDAVEFCKSQGDNVAATITPQHILLNRNAMLVGGIRPHLYCLPILKRESHRVAVTAAATGGDKSSSSARIARPTPRAPRKARVDAPGCSPRTRRSPFTPWRSRRRASWEISRRLRRTTGRISTACPGTRGPLRWSARRGSARGSTSSAVTWWCPSWLVRRFPGAWWRRDERGVLVVWSSIRFM